jgi:hypothetical protein
MSHSERREKSSSFNLGVSQMKIPLRQPADRNDNCGLFQ